MRKTPWFSMMVVALAAASTTAACGSEPQDVKSATDKSSGGGSGVKVGDKAPTFAVDSLNAQGKAQIAPGKVTIVDFWATWCEPCKKSFPKYQELYVKYKASGLEIIAVAVDDEKTAVPDFAKTHGAKFAVGWDDGHKIVDKWRPGTMPSAYVVDKQGVVRHVHEGYRDGEEAEIEKEIKALF